MFSFINYFFIININLLKYKIKGDKVKRKILRNMVNPEIGKYILDQAMNIPDENQPTLFD